eukprot:TRINITY_DN1328_c0_g1_i1.p1 TRINITY_DN1328_c0_g1~~TRINITY_DN1328_c0_g1_i1.p1  ORF type:complete len:105 (-),score=12.75 TRINITY_DN1328_c0_g1_i1:84-398(-)
MNRLPPKHVYSISITNKSAASANCIATYTNHEGQSETVSKKVDRNETITFDENKYEHITTQFIKNISKLSVKLDGNKHFEVDNWNVSSPTKNLAVEITNDGIRH